MSVFSNISKGNEIGARLHVKLFIIFMIISALSFLLPIGVGAHCKFPFLHSIDMAAKNNILFYPTPYHLFQSKQLFILAVGILLFCSGISFLLTRHVLASISRLRSGMHAVAQLKFDTYIPPVSKDALSILINDFNKMAHSLHKLEQIRSQWLADVSHELRNQLSIIRGEIEALQDGVRDLNISALNTLHAETLLVLKTVGDLHAISLKDSDGLRFDRMDINPIQILKNMLLHYDVRFLHHHIVLEDQINGCKDVYIKGDRLRLQQLFTNIFENALRYTTKPGRLTVSRHHSNQRLEIIFEDSGPGISPQDMEHIFDRRFRGEASCAGVIGSGLGLSICKAIVDAHHGIIRAEKGDSGGLKISISFPLSK